MHALRRMESLGELKRVAVFRALVLGDLLCIIPAVRALRRALPHAHITLIGLPWAEYFVARFEKYFDDFIEFPGMPGLPEREVDIHAFPKFLTAVQARQFDLVLQMHGSGSFVNPLVVLMGAANSAGYYEPGDYCPNEQLFMPYPDDVPEVHRHLRLMEFLGVPLDGDELEFPVREEDYAALNVIPEIAHLKGQPYICIHPGARYQSRRWKPDRFARVADLLAAEGYAIVITGSAAEASLVESVASVMTRPAIKLAGRTSLGSLAALLKGSHLVMSNDTGISHVAAALKVRSVVVVTGSDPERWAPLNRDLHQLVMKPVECRPCEHLVCPIGFPCADNVSVEDVANRAIGILSAR